MRSAYELENGVGRLWDETVVPLSCICKEEQKYNVEEQNRHGEEEEGHRCQP